MLGSLPPRPYSTSGYVMEEKKPRWLADHATKQTRTLVILRRSVRTLHPRQGPALLLPTQRSRFVEATHADAELVPDELVRKQTLHTIGVVTVLNRTPLHDPSVQPCLPRMTCPRFRQGHPSLRAIPIDASLTSALAAPTFV